MPTANIGLRKNERGIVDARNILGGISLAGFDPRAVAIHPYPLFRGSGGVSQTPLKSCGSLLCLAYAKHTIRISHENRVYD